MPRGPKKHLKRLNAPSHWMLDKMGGAWAPRPSTGPHKLRECLPIILILRNRLKYALNRREVIMICMRRLIQIDGKSRTDPCFPAGFQDVVTLGKPEAALSDGDNIDRFRILYDVKGRFKLHPIDAKDAKTKLCKVVKQAYTRKGIPYIVTHDGRTIRYHDPIIKVNDTVKVNIATGKVDDIMKFETGCNVIVINGKNRGRYGRLETIQRHPGSFNIVNVRDADGHSFATRLGNVFALSKSGEDFTQSMPTGRGVKLTIVQEREKALRARR